ncbi:hypothetical protein B0T14DRAFT_566505 [Immersiella caudata]|uniref:Heterokaryon incompatibility protein n=1 Tax=Immersiella caudata TaxID=314043 RepID=A0AA39WQE2_9PEZI|nr:hypothetical protein B0T14DRAFT_566505 [Immersiella caudata]
MTPRDKLDAWEKALASYRARHLTYPERDSLVAIAAIARALAPPDDPYIAGHFRSTLPRTLAWRSNERDRWSRRRLRACSPSWSWASVSNHDYTEFYSAGRALATLLSHSLELIDHGNPYGLVSSASLTLECNPISLNFQKWWNYGNEWEQVSEARELWSQIMLNEDMLVTSPDDMDHFIAPGTELYIIPIFQSEDEATGTVHVEGLVTQRDKCGAETVYKRVGHITMDFTTASRGKQGVGEEERKEGQVGGPIIPLLRELPGWEWKTITLV